MPDITMCTIIGIDPGVKTGIACKHNGEILWANTLTIWQLFEQLDAPGYGGPNHNVLYVIEDARKRKWFGSNSASKVQGAGWIKVFCGQIEAYMKERGKKHRMIAPIKGGTKLTASMVKKITGFDQVTNEHERDAIMIAWTNSITAFV